MGNKKNAVKKRRVGKIIGIICGCVAAALIIADIVIGNYMVSFAIGRNSVGETDVAPEPEMDDEAQAVISKNWERIDAETNEWLKTANKELVSVNSDDGLHLEGDLFNVNENSHKYVIAIHGYSGSKSTMYSSAKVYADRDYNILTPDLRGHGVSEGDYIGMGWLDRKDILKWIDMIIERDPQAEIIL